MKSNILFNAFKNNEKIVLDLEENQEGKKADKKPPNENFYYKMR